MDMAQRSIPDVTTLGEAGDLGAPPGSRPWAIAIRLEIGACIHNSETSAERLAWLTKTMAEHAGYTQLTDERGRPFATYQAFCQAKQPWGLGISADVINRIVNERMTAQARAQQPAMLLDDRGPATEEEKSNSDYIRNTVAQDGGTSANYLTARIARDRPDILERMQAGEYPSVRAAALDAGIVRPRISIPSDVDGAARALARKFTIEELHRLVELLAERIAVDV